MELKSCVNFRDKNVLFPKIKTISDNLSLVGHPLTMVDLVTQVLASLDIEYNPIVVQHAKKGEYVLGRFTRCSIDIRVNWNN